MQLATIMNNEIACAVLLPNFLSPLQLDQFATVKINRGFKTSFPFEFDIYAKYVKCYFYSGFTNHNFAFPNEIIDFICCAWVGFMKHNFFPMKLIMIQTREVCFFIIYRLIAQFNSKEKPLKYRLQ